MYLDLSISVANNTASTIKIGTQATQVVMDPQVVTITPAGSDVGELYTITGLDQFGKTQTEVMTAQSAGTTVIGEKVFSQITSIVPTSSSASTVKVGTQKVGRLSISHTIDELDFKIMAMKFFFKYSKIMKVTKLTKINYLLIIPLPQGLQIPQICLVKGCTTLLLELK